ncbi:hypothetical protein Tco_1543966 [Tanacetum coccineum]
MVEELDHPYVLDSIEYNRCCLLHNPSKCMVDVKIRIVGPFSFHIRIWSLETDIRQKDKKSSQKRQNQARNGKAWKRQSQIEAKDQKVNKSQPNGQLQKVNSQSQADIEEYLMGQTRTHLMDWESPLVYLLKTNKAQMKDNG